MTFMEREVDYEPIAEMGVETEIIGTRISEYWVRSPYHVLHNGKNVGVFFENYSPAISLAAVVETYGDVELDSEREMIPLEVALDGNTAIATYLHGVQRLPKAQIAEIMDITEGSVQEYLRRFRPHYNSL